MKLPASGNLTGRAITEWVGATPDSPIPDRVKLRVFERYSGRCAITGKVLRPLEWDCDHKTPLKEGGEHRESNLQPVWRIKHREKTAEENSERARLQGKREKHLLPKPKSKWPSRPMGQRFTNNTKQLDEAYDD